MEEQNYSSSIRIDLTGWRKPRQLSKDSASAQRNHNRWGTNHVSSDAGDQVCMERPGLSLREGESSSEIITYLQNWRDQPAHVGCHWRTHRLNKIQLRKAFSPFDYSTSDKYVLTQTPRRLISQVEPQNFFQEDNTWDRSRFSSCRGLQHIVGHWIISSDNPANKCLYASRSFLYYVTYFKSQHWSYFLPLVCHWLLPVIISNNSCMRPSVTIWRIWPKYMQHCWFWWRQATDWWFLKVLLWVKNIFPFMA